MNLSNKYGIMLTYINLEECYTGVHYSLSYM